MSAFTKLTEAITCRYHDKIKKACTPLFDYFNLCDFWHYRIKNSGHFYSFGTHVNWTAYSATKECYLASPYHRHPKFFQSGISLLRAMPDESYLEMLDSGKNKFNIHHCFQFIIKIPEGIEAFGFSSNSPDQWQNAMLLSELPLFRLFIKKFKKENRSLFSCLEDNQIDLAEQLGSTFYKQGVLVTPQDLKKQSLLRNLGVKIENIPTIREIEVARLLIRGLSASLMAKELFLSTRTVEHRVERMKEKLGCESRTELVQKMIELEEFGFLG